MSVAELMPSIQALPRSDKLRLIELLAADLAREEHAGQGGEIVLRPEDKCPYSASELMQMRGEEGGRTLAEVWQGLGRS